MKEGGKEASGVHQQNQHESNSPYLERVIAVGNLVISGDIMMLVGDRSSGGGTLAILLTDSSGGGRKPAQKGTV